MDTRTAACAVGSGSLAARLPEPGLPRGSVPDSIRRLQPYDANVGKRLVKSPKLYWRDTGLLHSLLGGVPEAALLDQPWVGASWEGFVIEQLLALLAQRDHRAEAGFFRTSDQQEVDLVLDFGAQLWAIEIKLTATPGLDAMRRLNQAADLIGARKRILISRTPRSVAERAGDLLQPAVVRPRRSHPPVKAQPLRPHHERVCRSGARKPVTSRPSRFLVPTRGGLRSWDRAPEVLFRRIIRRIGRIAAGAAGAPRPGAG